MNRQENEEKRKKKKWLLLLLLLLLLFIITIVGTIIFLKGDKDSEATGADLINTENETSDNIQDEDINQEDSNTEEIDTENTQFSSEDEDNSDITNSDENDENVNDSEKNNNDNNNNNKPESDDKNNENNNSSDNNGSDDTQKDDESSDTSEDNKGDDQDNEGADSSKDNTGDDQENGDSDSSEDNIGDDKDDESIDKIQKFTVEFKDYDGTVLKSEEVEEGKGATAPANPTREGYTFTGWDKEFANITANITVTAIYRINTYTVTFKDHDGTELDKQTIKYGESAIEPKTPPRRGYTFVGWDKEFANITADITVTANYEINAYTVKFVDYDGTELKEENVTYGEGATAPSDPTREGYTFTGWNKDFTNVTSNITVTAKYKVNTYTVTFKDYNGATLKTQIVEHGKGATAPANPTREGYTFTGWDKGFANITVNTTVTANYEINKYTVTFKDYNGTTLKTQTVEHGKGAIAPVNPAREGYIFIGWDKEFANITENITVTANYEINKYTVTFKDYNGTTLKTQTVEHGKGATAPANPTREGYTFTGWDKEFANITTNIDITAQYKESILELKSNGKITIERIKDDYEFNAIGADKIKFHFNVSLSNIVKDTSIVDKYVVELYKGNQKISSKSVNSTSGNVNLELPQIVKIENVTGEEYSFKIIVYSKAGKTLELEKINIKLNVVLAGTLVGTTVRFKTEETLWYTGFFFGETKAELTIN